MDESLLSPSSFFARRDVVQPCGSGSAPTPVWNSWLLGTDGEEALAPTPHKRKALTRRYEAELRSWHEAHRAQVRAARAGREALIAQGKPAPPPVPDARVEVSVRDRNPGEFRLRIGHAGHTLAVRYAPGFRAGHAGHLWIEARSPAMEPVAVATNLFVARTGFPNLAAMVAGCMDRLVASYFEHRSAEHTAELFRALHHQSSAAHDSDDDDDDDDGGGESEGRLARPAALASAWSCPDDEGDDGSAEGGAGTASTLLRADSAGAAHPHARRKAGGRGMTAASAFAEVWGAVRCSSTPAAQLRAVRTVLREELRALQSLSLHSSAQAGQAAERATQAQRTEADAASSFAAAAAAAGFVSSATEALDRQREARSGGAVVRIRDVSQLFRWELELLFGEEDGDMGPSLRRHAARHGSSGALRVEIKFPETFPAAAPVVRVLGPVLADFTGRVSQGAIATSVLYSPAAAGSDPEAEWSPVVVPLLLRLRETLMSAGAAVNEDVGCDYAADAFEAVHKRLLQASRRPSAGAPRDYSESLSAWSISCAVSQLGLEVRVPDEFHSGNKLLLPTAIDIVSGGGSRVLEVVPQDAALDLPALGTPCGFHSSIAPKGMVVFPDHLHRSMMLQEGSQVLVRTVELPKVSRIELKPHRAAWRDECPIPFQPFLRTAIQRWACFSAGEVITLRVSKADFESRPDYAIHHQASPDFSAVFTVQNIAPDVPAAKIWTAFAADIKYSFAPALDDPEGTGGAPGAIGSSGAGGAAGKGTQLDWAASACSGYGSSPFASLTATPASAVAAAPAALTSADATVRRLSLGHVDSDGTLHDEPPSAHADADAVISSFEDDVERAASGALAAGSPGAALAGPASGSAERGVVGVAESVIAIGVVPLLGGATASGDRRTVGITLPVGASCADLHARVRSAAPAPADVPTLLGTVPSARCCTLSVYRPAAGSPPESGAGGAAAAAGAGTAVATPLVRRRRESNTLPFDSATFVPDDATVTLESLGFRPGSPGLVAQFVAPVTACAPADEAIVTYFVGGQRLGLSEQNDCGWLRRLACHNATTAAEMEEFSPEFVLANLEAPAM
ncbi:hypothetical protein FNF29_04246 [Cafeteria roenbergensis]|uniref:RWD domain-containing protein n=1 Tax=Cafeteria roenbergensis TaxID=33653 RepID=A0A5A8CI88_CAFRO|nr:hypothetical protein FNF29_04246 [Cafeteria roenbergensis]|eukprot:KAA0151840.1 hypothetical protein FNF29_04246 [Cafeteria roenbergensis]